jgi:hypothetical protein
MRYVIAGVLVLGWLIYGLWRWKQDENAYFFAGLMLALTVLLLELLITW